MSLKTGPHPLFRFAKQPLPPFEGGGALFPECAASLGAVLAVAITLVSHVMVQPKASEPVLALGIWLPGAIAAVALITSLLPGLARLVMYRSTLVAPARLVAAGMGVANDVPQPTP